LKEKKGRERYYQRNGYVSEMDEDEEQSDWNKDKQESRERIK
jgi:hypothetical protein